MRTKFGKYDCPVIDLDAALKLIEIFIDKFKGKEMSRETFMQNVIELSPTSSWTIKVLATLGKYGLVELDKGQVKSTTISENAIKGTPDEQKEAKSNAVLNVELFKDLNAKYGLNVDQTQVLVFLKEEGGAGTIEANNGASMVTKIYMSNAKHIIPAEGAVTEKKPSGRGDKPVEDVGIPEGALGIFHSKYHDTIIVSSTDMFATLKEFYESREKPSKTLTNVVPSKEGNVNKKEEQK